MMVPRLVVSALGVLTRPAVGLCPQHVAEELYLPDPLDQLVLVQGTSQCLVVGFV